MAKEANVNEQPYTCQDARFDFRRVTDQASATVRNDEPNTMTIMRADKTRIRTRWRRAPPRTAASTSTSLTTDIMSVLRKLTSSNRRLAARGNRSSSISKSATRGLPDLIENRQTSPPITSNTHL